MKIELVVDHSYITWLEYSWDLCMLSPHFWSSQGNHGIWRVEKD